MTIVVFLCLVYFLYTFILSTLAVNVGIIKSQGLATTPHNDAVNNIVSFALILGCSTRYLGWIGGLIAFAFHLLSLAHATFGWLLSVPSALRFRRIAAERDSYAGLEALRQHSSRVESRFTVFTWGYCIFFIYSLFRVPFGAFRPWWTLPHILIFAGICAAGFIARMLVGPKMQPVQDADNDLISY